MESIIWHKDICDNFIRMPIKPTIGELNIDRILNFLNSDDKETVFLNQPKDTRSIDKTAVLINTQGLRFDSSTKNTVCWQRENNCKLIITAIVPGEEAVSIPIIIHHNNSSFLNGLDGEYKQKYNNIFSHSPGNTILTTWQYSFLWILNVLYEGLNQRMSVSDILMKTIQHLENLNEVQREKTDTEKYKKIKEHIKKNAIKAIAGVNKTDT